MLFQGWGSAASKAEPLPSGCSYSGELKQTLNDGSLLSSNPCLAPHLTPHESRGLQDSGDMRQPLYLLSWVSQRLPLLQALLDDPQRASRALA